MKCMCDIRVNKECVIGQGKDVYVLLGRDPMGYYLRVSGAGFASKRINYCPCCGKDLAKKNL